MKIKKKNLKTTDDFISRYQTEMLDNIAKMKESIRLMRTNPEDTSFFQEIKNNWNSINDLAMVYGYEGVELIGKRIIQMLDNFNKNSDIEELLSHLNDATKAIENDMYLIDESKERELIRDLSFSTNEDENNDFVKNRSETEENDKEFLFDIREDEKLISLLKDANGQATELQQTDETGDEKADIGNIIQYP